MNAFERLYSLIQRPKDVRAVKQHVQQNGLDPIKGAEVFAKVGDPIMAARYIAAAGILDEAEINRLLDLANKNNVPD